MANGQAAAQVARLGLLRPRKPDTVYAWLDRFLSEGLDGLVVRAGPGHKPAFSPLYLDAEDAAAELQHLVRRTRRACGLDQTRWTLDGIKQACDWLSDLTPVASIGRWIAWM